MQDEFPDKRPRPVNLKLSGDFLENLTFTLASKRGGGYGIRIGYYDELSKKKELGHAIGVNGQPKRPTIPESVEDFTSAIRQRILQEFKKLVEKATK